MQEKRNETNDIRVRFAPAPTGMLHLGNIRTALINYLFANQKKGTLILRIEDTDFQRNFDPEAKNIIENLKWLNLDYEEGPILGGPYEPYFQSKRTKIYSEHLERLKSKNLIYRCFCSQEDLEKKRKRQIALRQPPRYDRTCLKLTDQEIKLNIEQKKPFIWRMKVPQDQVAKFIDLARGELEFDLKNFSDYPITRQDGSFTFIFANCVDDILMKMTHVFRGEDHISNTVDQIVLYNAFESPYPVFYHMPILCDVNGKKLSKRTFGFSLNELRESGYLSEAICNYLAIIGGSFDKEIQSLDELIQNFNFENIHSTGFIKYDIEKLNWVNHKWISQYDLNKFAELCLPYLKKVYPEIASLDNESYLKLIELIKNDCVTLKDSINLAKFYFIEPAISKEEIIKQLPEIDFNATVNVIKENIQYLNVPDKFLEEIKKAAKENKIKLNILLPLIRYAIIGSIHGPNVHELINILDAKIIEKRINNLLKAIQL